MREGFTHPGGRFLSARAVVQRFAISYQTAHRLLTELHAEGLLRRESASGSYIPGRRGALVGVHLIFHRRARRKGSFGAHLLELLRSELEKRGISYVHGWPEPTDQPRLRRDYYPVVWECPRAVQRSAAERKFVLCLNDRPPSGLDGRYVDAVTTDDYSGGACAADLLRARVGSPRGFAVLGGPEEDHRSAQRIAGFKAHAADATVLCAPSWFVEAGRTMAKRLLARKPAGIFACNDRLAEALIVHARLAGCALPPLVGFDNAPVAERLGLTTVGIPWTAMVEHAMELVTARLNGETELARLVSLAHEPVLRLTA
jgi:DNA-binding transcriptional regulator YhcF (GntR family)